MRRRVGAGVLLLVSSLLSGPTAHAATTTTVTTTSDIVSDDGKCSLREAITSANLATPSGAKPGECPAITATDTVRLLAQRTYSLTKAGADEDNNLTGDLDITVAMNIVGARRTRITQTVDEQRVIDVRSGTVAITRVTISGGHAPDGFPASPPGRNGGGVRNLGTLTLEKVTVKGNATGNGGEIPGPGVAGSGGSGGGVYNDAAGTLFVYHSLISGNRAGNGGDSTPDGGLGTVPGSGGPGGGLYNAGSMTVRFSRIQRNAGGNGGDAVRPVPGGPPARPGGVGGSGGGIVNGSAAYIGSSTISANVGGSGGRGGDAPVPFAGPPTIAGPGGGGGSGGGIVMTTGATSTQVVDGIIRVNAGGRGGRGGNGSQAFAPTLPGGVGGPGGLGGYGGGLATSNFMTMTGTTVVGNSSGFGGPGGTGGPGYGASDGPPGPSGQTGGGGGAFVNTNGAFVVANSTFSVNRAGDSGGAISSASTTVMNNVTITRNVADADGQVGGLGGGVYQSNGSFSVQNTIVAGNAIGKTGMGPDCSGSFTSEYNLVTSIANCTGLGGGTGDITGRSARLGRLKNNGGPTPTHALLRGSPAINNGDPVTPSNTHCETNDQRGRDRVAKNDCDIGAFER